ncbi:MAG: dihydrodipicolinate synthase family protein, partial [Candidatus Bathyarchaeia archaeon]
EFLIKSGIHVLQPTGSTGEFFSLTPEEHKRVIKVVVEEAGGRVPVVPGTAHSGTKMTVEISRYAESVGADGVMIVPPYYQMPTLEGIYEHYKTVAESIKVGIVVYNNPWTSKITIGPELMRRLAEIPNVVAVKETTGNINLSLRLLKKLGKKLTFSMGSGEELAPYYYLSGAKGHVTAIGNFAPKFAVGMYEAAMRKDWDEVMKIHSNLMPYFELDNRLSEKNKGTMYISMTKEAMRMLGLPGYPPRKPLLPLNDREREELKNILNNIGVYPTTCT